MLLMEVVRAIILSLSGLGVIVTVLISAWALLPSLTIKNRKTVSSANPPEYHDSEIVKWISARHVIINL